MIELKIPKSIPNDILELGSEFDFNRKKLKETTNKIESLSALTNPRNKNSSSKIGKQRSRKKSVLGKKMLTYGNTLTPKNYSLNSFENAFTLKEKADIGNLFSKISFYMKNLDKMLKAKKVEYSANSNLKPGASYKGHSRRSSSFNPNIKEMSENWLSSMSNYDTMINKVNKKQNIFYETTKDEFRSYLDINNKDELNTDATANQTEDLSHDSEQEFMMEKSRIRVKKGCRNSNRPTTGIYYKNNFSNGLSSRNKSVNRLFRKDNPKTVTEFQKDTELIKNFCRQEYNNRVFAEVFNAVNNPNTIPLRKNYIKTMLDEQNMQCKKFTGTPSKDNLNKSRYRVFVNFM